MLLSVIITTYEQPLSLIPLLYCLRAQECRERFEVLICDDGSSEDVFRALAADKNLHNLDIRYIWQAKEGHQASRTKNNGIRCARGDMLIMLDADILVKPDFLERHVSARSQSRQIVCNPRRWILKLESTSAPQNVLSPLGGGVAVSELTDLAMSDLSAMFELLDRSYVEVDGPGQRELSQSSSPWMSCAGFSFSIDRAINDIYFDEAFEGWGPEDREFVLRMVTEHGYIVSFRDDIVVYHLEPYSTGRLPFNTLPYTHGQIVSYLRNMLYFRDLYPGEDLSILMEALSEFCLDTASQTWRQRSSEARTDLRCQMDAITRWLRKESLYPIRRIYSGRKHSF